jgi:hypothetical protein
VLQTVRPQGAAANPQGTADGVSLGQGVDPKRRGSSRSHLTRQACEHQSKEDCGNVTLAWASVRE